MVQLFSELSGGSGTGSHTGSVKGGGDYTDEEEEVIKFAKGHASLPPLSVHSRAFRAILAWFQVSSAPVCPLFCISCHHGLALGLNYHPLVTSPAFCAILAWFQVSAPTCKLSYVLCHLGLGPGRLCPQPLALASGFELKTILMDLEVKD